MVGSTTVVVIRGAVEHGCPRGVHRPCDLDGLTVAFVLVAICLFGAVVSGSWALNGISTRGQRCAGVVGLIALLGVVAYVAGLW